MLRRKVRLTAWVREECERGIARSVLEIVELDCRRRQAHSVRWWKKLLWRNGAHWIVKQIVYN